MGSNQVGRGKGPDDNVVRLPRDWLGPREELVPFGPSAGTHHARRRDSLAARTTSGASSPAPSTTPCARPTATPRLDEEPEWFGARDGASGPSRRRRHPARPPAVRARLARVRARSGGCRLRSRPWRARFRGRHAQSEAGRVARRDRGAARGPADRHRNRPVALGRPVGTPLRPAPDHGRRHNRAIPDSRAASRGSARLVPPPAGARPRRLDRTLRRIGAAPAIADRPGAVRGPSASRDGAAGALHANASVRLGHHRQLVQRRRLIAVGLIPFRDRRQRRRLHTSRRSQPAFGPNGTLGPGSSPDS